MKTALTVSIVKFNHSWSNRQLAKFLDIMCYCTVIPREFCCFGCLPLKASLQVWILIDAALNLAIAILAFYYQIFPMGGLWFLFIGLLSLTVAFFILFSKKPYQDCRRLFQGNINIRTYNNILIRVTPILKLNLKRTKKDLKSKFTLFWSQFFIWKIQNLPILGIR